ncbi:MAG: glycerol-3-phosphate 1-O-acyltransferase PlsY [Hyphomicrobiales bacterium]
MSGELPILTYVLAAIGGYLCGSIPFGMLITRIAGTEDIRSIGSGNIGATNVLRTGSKKLAAATLACDLLKGTIPTLIGLQFGLGAGIAAGIAAFVGHIFPVWLNFKGGKGVATYLGVVLGLSWMAALGFCVVWLVAAAVFRMSSLAGLTASALVPLWAYLAGSPQLVWPFFVMAAIIFFTHRENIGRLLTGRESKIKLGK